MTVLDGGDVRFWSMVDMTPLGEAHLPSDYVRSMPAVDRVSDLIVTA